MESSVLRDHEHRRPQRAGSILHVKEAPHTSMQDSHRVSFAQARGNILTHCCAICAHDRTPNRPRSYVVD